MQIIETIALKLGVKNWQVEAAVKLIDEGNTIPFIARYRKEATGTLTDEQLRELGESLAYLRSLEERKAKVMESIEAQGKLTAELKASIEAAQTLVEVEDLYLPYRPKRRTRAGIAKEKGLQGLADYILALKPGSDVRGEAARYIDEEKEVKDADEAIAGAMDIIAEQISDEARFRAWIREKTQARGTLITAEKARKKTKDEAETDEKTPAKLKERRNVYEMYFEYEEAVRKIPGHRVLAINRGEKEGFLSVKIAAPEEDILFYLERQVTRGAKDPDPDAFSYIKSAVKDSYDRLIAPAIERELRNQLTEEAEDGAIRVFASNLEQLRPGMGSCFPHGLQTGRSGSHRKDPRHKGDLSHSPAEQGQGGQAGAGEACPEIRCLRDQCRQRHSLEGIRAGDHRIHQRAEEASAVCDRQ